MIYNGVWEWTSQSKSGNEGGYVQRTVEDENILNCCVSDIYDGGGMQCSNCNNGMIINTSPITALMYKMGWV